MSERRLRYSERKLLAETGSLGDLRPEPSAQLRNALGNALKRALGAIERDAKVAFRTQTQSACAEFFGWADTGFVGFALEAEGDDFNDYLEILVEHAQARYELAYGYSVQPWPDVVEDLNRIFDRHRYAFRFQGQEIHAIASPALEEVMIGPALLAASRPGWEQVERSFREALLHQRGPSEENDDALTAANAALEAALRAMGFEGKTLGELGRSLRNAALVPSHLAGAPKMIDDLLQRSNAIRSQHGDAHGKAPDAEEVPQSLVNLAVHLAGAFIVYLSELSVEGECA